MAIESLLECVFCAAYVCFSCGASGDCCSVYYCLCEAIPLQGAVFFFPAVTCFVCSGLFVCVCSAFFYYVSVVCAYDRFDVRCTAVAYFDLLSVEYFEKFILSCVGKVFVDEVEKLFADVGCYGCVIGWVIPQYCAFSCLVFLFLSGVGCV